MILPRREKDLENLKNTEVELLFVVEISSFLCRAAKPLELLLSHLNEVKNSNIKMQYNYTIKNKNPINKKR